MSNEASEFRQSRDRYKGSVQIGQNHIGLLSVKNKHWL